MEVMQTVLDRHTQQLKMLERELAHLKAVQNEIRNMNELLVMLTNELKHTNEHLARHEKKIEAIESQPQIRNRQIFTAIISALATGLVSFFIGIALT